MQGDLTTDVDALTFDRKTGAPALFELKSQDLFAYSRQERIRQRDYFYNAGKQVLRLVHEMPFGAEDAHPIQSLYNTLLKDTPLALSSSVLDVQEITIGDSAEA